MGADTAKKVAAEAALGYLPQAGLVGLGTGSTARFFIEGVARLVAQGRRLVGVPTSETSARQARESGIPLAGVDGPWDISVVVDGADEVDARGHLIKGGGGALTREKIISHAARKRVIVVDPSKLSRRLGEKFNLPVEVLRFGHKATAKALGVFGAVKLRELAGKPFLTDSGSYIYDVTTGPMEDPVTLEGAINLIPGVVENGLFVGRADVVIVGTEDGAEVMQFTV